MVKKKIDNRIRVLIENGIQLNHRSLIVLVGDKGRDQVILPVRSLSSIIYHLSLGGHSTSYAFQSTSESTSNSLMVLQKRT